MFMWEHSGRRTPIFYLYTAYRGWSYSNDGALIRESENYFIQPSLFLKFT